MADDVEKARRDRAEGRARNGTVGIRSFDEGVALTLRATYVDDNLFIRGIKGFQLAPGEPGVPVIFGFPEDVFEKFKIPAVTINRDDISPALQRWHPGALQYRGPAPDALPVRVGTREGFSKYEQMQQAVPFDLTYSLVLYTQRRTQGNLLLDHTLRIYPPYCNVKVQDTEGDYRLYSAFTEGIGTLDDVPEVGDRVIAFGITLRVEAELDLNDPETFSAVTRLNPRFKTEDFKR